MSIPLQPNTTYHIFNRANGNEKIFLNNGNYIFFLEKYKTYISPISDTFCYCLMPNHFHFLIRIKDDNHIKELIAYTNTNIKKHTHKNTFTIQEKDTATISNFLSLQFGHFQNSYAKAFNKQQRRMGSLFMKTFKRKIVSDKKYLQNLVHYIHFNPVQAGLCKNPESWKYSSFNAILSQHPEWVLRDEVINLFVDKENFKNWHT